MNKEEKVEACKTLTLKEPGVQYLPSRQVPRPVISGTPSSKRFAQHKACMLNFLFKFFFP
jgi:hypothetical protein